MFPVGPKPGQKRRVWGGPSGAALYNNLATETRDDTAPGGRVEVNWTYEGWRPNLKGST